MRVFTMFVVCMWGHWKHFARIVCFNFLHTILLCTTVLIIFSCLLKWVAWTTIPIFFPFFNPVSVPFVLLCYCCTSCYTCCSYASHTIVTGIAIFAALDVACQFVDLDADNLLLVVVTSIVQQYAAIHFFFLCNTRACSPTCITYYGVGSKQV